MLEGRHNCIATKRESGVCVLGFLFLLVLPSVVSSFFFSLSRVVAIVPFGVRNGSKEKREKKRETEGEKRVCLGR